MIAGHDDERPARAVGGVEPAPAGVERANVDGAARDALDGIDILRSLRSLVQPCASHCRHFWLLAFVGCNNTSPLDAALPSLPPKAARRSRPPDGSTPSNFDAERVPGPASQGLVGDYFMRNDKVRIVVQAPNRAIGPCPFGGNVIDADRVAQPAGDQLGEVSAFLQLGRTFAFDRADVVRDGGKGGPAVLRFYGHDAKNDFIDVVGLGGFALAVQDDYRADVDLKLRRR